MSGMPEVWVRRLRSVMLTPRAGRVWVEATYGIACLQLSILLEQKDGCRGELLGERAYAEARV
jgi:hypothetical protein